MNVTWCKTPYRPAAQKRHSALHLQLHGLARFTPTNTHDVLASAGVGLSPAEFAQDGFARRLWKYNKAVVPVAAPVGRFFKARKLKIYNR